MVGRIVLGLACGLTACAPITSSRRVNDVPRADKIAVGKPQHGDAQLEASATSDGIIVTSTDTMVCRESRTKVVHRKIDTHRSVNKPFTVFEYVLGLGLVVPGAYTLGFTQDAIDRVGATNLKTDQARLIGGAATGVGGLFLLFGIVNSFRGGTSHRDVGNIESPLPQGPPVACGSTPRKGDLITLAVGTARVAAGATDAAGKLEIKFADLKPELFDGDWKNATVVGAGSARVELTAARAAVAEREFNALAVAPSLDAARAYRTRFGSSDKIDTLIVQLADATYAGPTNEALDRGDVAAAKASIEAWTKDAPDSAMLIVNAAQVANLEKVGPAEYFHASFAAAIITAGADRKQYLAAERALLAFAKAAPTDKRVPEARAQLKERQKALVALANKHVDQAKTFEGKQQWADAAAELEAARQLAPDDAGTAARIKRAETKLPAGTVVAKVETTAVKPAAEDPKAKAAEAKAKAAAEAQAKKEEKERLAAEAKAKAEEAKAKAAAEAQAKKEEKERLAAEAKAKAEEEKQRAAEEAKAKQEEKERLAVEAKAKADEAKAKAAEEKARLAEQKAKTADEKKAAAAQAKEAAAETARLAAEEKARKLDEQKRLAEAARLAGAAEAAKKQAAEAAKKQAAETARLAAAAEAAKKAEAKARGKGAVAVAEPARMTGAPQGLWATLIGNVIWLVDLKADGSGTSALWDGRMIAMRPIRWQLDGDRLSVAAGTSSIAGRAHNDAATMGWLGTVWRRQ